MRGPIVQSVRRSGTRCAATGLLCIGIALGMAAIADSPSNTSVGLSPGASGAEVYVHICQGCHMREAQGAVGAGHYPKLAGDAALVSWEYVAVTILNGRKGMPAFGATPDPGTERFAAHLSDAQVAAVVNYVRGSFGNHYKPSATAASVAALPHPGASPEP